MRREDVKREESTERGGQSEREKKETCAHTHTFTFTCTRTEPSQLDYDLGKYIHTNIYTGGIWFPPSEIRPSGGRSSTSKIEIRAGH